MKKKEQQPQPKRGRKFNPETRRIGVCVGFPAKVERALRRHVGNNGNSIANYVTNLVVKDLGISVEGIPKIS